MKRPRDDATKGSSKRIRGCNSVVTHKENLMTTDIKGTRIAVLAFLVLSLALATAAWAQSTSPEAMMTTYLCRPALSGETASAKMVTTSALLVCKPFALSMQMSDGAMKTIGNVTAKADSGPDFGSALTVQQAHTAYNLWVQKTFHIDPATAHTN
jgi:hypothetical protein